MASVRVTLMGVHVCIVALDTVSGGAIVAFVFLQEKEWQGAALLIVENVEISSVLVSLDIMEIVSSGMLVSSGCHHYK